MRVKMEGRAPSWLCQLALLGYHKTCMLVHPGSMFRVVYHAHKHTDYGTKVFLLESNPVEFLGFNNNTALDIAPSRLFLGTPEQWSAEYEGVRFNAVIINCRADTAILDIWTMWEHVKPQGRLVAVMPPEALCQNPKIKYTDAQYELADHLGHWADETWATVLNMPDDYYEGDGQPPQVFIAVRPHDPIG